MHGIRCTIATIVRVILLGFDIPEFVNIKVTNRAIDGGREDFIQAAWEKGVSLRQVGFRFLASCIDCNQRIKARGTWRRIALFADDDAKVGSSIIEELLVNTSLVVEEGRLPVMIVEITPSADFRGRRNKHAKASDDVDCPEGPNNQRQMFLQIIEAVYQFVEGSHYESRHESQHR